MNTIIVVMPVGIITIAKVAACPDMSRRANKFRRLIPTAVVTFGVIGHYCGPNYVHFLDLYDRVNILKQYSVIYRQCWVHSSTLIDTTRAPIA